ncbi:hypothetical protein N0V91_001291 [Didymella pomorum]|uniref:NAP family protein n=1 Tax=Didymella pomorum TaxID=749634 RepID=A0A9W8ZMH5_9PLEO|nr:hypothetical protein N0V91_001291 [Didymella pomorum]
MPHDHSQHAQTAEQIQASFEQLGLLETKFEEAEDQVIRKTEEIKASVYKERTEFVKNIPHFWSLVFENCPPEVENFIQPTDSEVLADCFETFEVSRFELDDPKGSPKSFSLKFGFGENEWFENKTLEKKFWYRSAQDGWEGLVSEPVKINWKKGKDLTGGLTDAAVKLHQARTKVADRKKEAALPEYKELAKKIETSADASVSFFGLFAFVSGYRWVSAEESEKEVQKNKEALEKIRAGGRPDEEEDDEDDEDPMDYQETEVFPGGDEVATIIAEDMWPKALVYYKQTFEQDEDDEDLSEVDFDMDEDDDSGEEVDIRALVGKGKKDKDEPPSKKQRKA